MGNRDIKENFRKTYRNKQHYYLYMLSTLFLPRISQATLDIITSVAKTQVRYLYTGRTCLCMLPGEETFAGC